MTLKPGLGWLKVIENDTVRSGTHDFLLTFHGNHRPISHRFRDKRRFPSKIANFSHHRVFNAPAELVLLGIGYRCKGPKSFSDRATRRSKKFLDKFSRLDTIPGWQTNRQTDRHVAVAKTALCVARVTRSSADADNRLDAFISGQSSPCHKWRHTYLTTYGTWHWVDTR